MIIWNIKKLKEKINSVGISEEEQFGYLLAYTIVLALLFIPSGESTRLELLSSILSIPISVFGLYYIYTLNGGANGQNFLAKYLAIGFVVSVRIILPLIAVVFLLGIVEGVSEGIIQNNVSGFDWFLELFIPIFFELLCIWRIAVHMKDTVATLGETVA